MELTPSYRSLTSPARYAQMVSNALAVLNEERGVSFERISNYIMTHFNIHPSPNHFTQVARNLEKMTKMGTVLLINGLYKYRPIPSAADHLRAPLGMLNSPNGFGILNQPRLPFVNSMDAGLNSTKFQYAGGNVSNDVHVNMNNNVHVHMPTPASNHDIVPTDEGPSKRGRGRPRKVPISAVKVEPAVIELDEDDDAAQNNVGDRPPIPPVAKKARRVGGKSLAEEYVSKAKEPPRPTCKEVYEVVSNVNGITDDEVMRAVKRFVNGKVDEFDMLKSLPDNRKKRSWILTLINE